MKKGIKIISGFILLFGLYHLAEYFVIFKNNPYAFLLCQIIFFLSAWAIARWQGFKGLSAWGLDRRKYWRKHLITGMLLGVFLYSLTYVISLMWGSEMIKEVPGFRIIVPQLGLFWFGVFFSSFSEDILTRGYPYKHFGNGMSPVFFILLSASVYLLNHIYRLADGWETLSYLFALGILFAIPLVKSKRLWITGGMHWMGNTVFYFTNNIIQTETVAGKVLPNTIFIVCIFLMIPVVFGAMKVFRINYLSVPQKI